MWVWVLHSVTQVLLIWCLHHPLGHLIIFRIWLADKGKEREGWIPHEFLWADLEATYVTSTLFPLPELRHMAPAKCIALCSCVARKRREFSGHRFSSYHITSLAGEEPWMWMWGKKLGWAQGLWIWASGWGSKLSLEDRSFCWKLGQKPRGPRRVQEDGLLYDGDKRSQSSFMYFQTP